MARWFLSTVFLLRLCPCNVWLQCLFTCFDARVQTTACSCIFFQKTRDVWGTLSVRFVPRSAIIIGIEQNAAKQYSFRRHLPEIHCFKKKEVLNPNVTLSWEFGLGQGSKKIPDEILFLLHCLSAKVLSIGKIDSSKSLHQEDLQQNCFATSSVSFWPRVDTFFYRIPNAERWCSGLKFLSSHAVCDNIDSIPLYMTSQITFICWNITQKKNIYIYVSLF